MFLVACAAVFGLMFLFGPDELGGLQYRALGVTWSVLVGFLAYFTCGSFKSVAELEKPGYFKVGLCLMAALAVVAVVYGLWEMGVSPVNLRSP